ncbi:sarcosine oxidase subunit gamma [Tardiphaga sp. 709]|uniref:sarcosine oxidase subunit gamma n=1 Tax=Tardiphaga sp. 709 TaxID=3076039 RepID=UPI0028E81840|nr:sarcosine oxidase subunit gamma family protein [Tardiphaga sp. 709]WNV08277.1 sarcosine oxidase subunit gamma family protein [Tardiphaga sp. 709]
MLDLPYVTAFSGLRSIGDGRGVIARERRGIAIATVMARKGQGTALAATVKEQFDINLPLGPHGSGGDATSFLGTGPGRWLVTHDAGTPRFVDSLAQQLDGLASVVDQSDSVGLLRLSGPALLEVLAKGVGIDLSATAFPAGSVAVTQIAHMGVTLWKVDETPTIHIAAARSMAGSFLHWLEASAAMVGLAVDAEAQ